MAVVSKLKNNAPLKVITNEDNKPINMSNNTVIDGYAGNDIERYSKYIDGTRLTVDYYSFVRGSNGENSPLDPNDDTQQYVKIKQLELVVTTPVSPNSYQDISVDVVIDAGLVPAENDMVVFRLFNGQLGMFKVSDITTRSYIARKIYDCKLDFQYYEVVNAEYFTSLFSKVVKNYVYDKNYISTNSAPIILEPTYKSKLNLINNFNSLLQSYLSMFLHNRVLAFTDDTNSFYDGGIQKLVLSLVDDDQFKMIKVVEDTNEVETIVDFLISKKSSMNTRYDRYEIDEVKFNLQLDRDISISSARIKNHILMSNDSKDNPFLQLGLAGSTIIPNNYRTEPTNLYLFSNLFYSDNHNGIDELSELESLVLKYLDNETIDSKQLDSIIDDMNNWTRIEIFYYAPILLMIMRYSTLNTYDRI